MITPLCGFLFLSKPQKAEAVVPVNDAKHIAVSEAGWAFYYEKEYWLDHLLWVALKAIINTILRQVTQWIRTGDWGGGPLWFLDVKRWGLEEANRLSGIFLEEYLDPAIYDFLCSPFRQPIYLALTRQRSNRLTAYSRNYMPRCTLSTMVNNIGGYIDFMNHFSTGGWEAWNSIVSEPNNNPYGAYLDSVMSMEAKTQRGEENAKTESEMQNGYRGQKICELFSPQGNYCEEFSIDSPGTWVGDTLYMNTTSEIRTLEHADEISELLGALYGMLLQRLMGGIGGNVTGGNNLGAITGPGATVDSGAINSMSNIIQGTIDNQNEYISVLTSTRNTLQNALNTYIAARDAYTAYLNAINARPYGTTPAVDPAQIQSIINGINTQIASINGQISSLNSNISSSQSTLSQLTSLQTQINNTTNPDELTNLTLQYQTLSQSSANAYDIFQANTALDDSQNTQNSATQQLTAASTLPQPAYLTEGGNSSGGGGGGEGM